MSISAALVILAVCVAMSLLLCAPFLLLARRRRKKSRSAPIAGVPSREVPLRELPAVSAYVCVMFYGFAHAYIAPDTWFGAQMKTTAGRLAFIIVPILVIVAVRSGWREFVGARKDRRNTGTE